MTRRAVYLCCTDGPDIAIQRGLAEAGCELVTTINIAQTIESLREAASDSIPLLVAEVQAGALALLALLRDCGNALPTTLLFDRQGVDIHAPIKALEFGVRAYLLASQPELERQMAVRVMAERSTLLSGESQRKNGIARKAELAPARLGSGLSADAAFITSFMANDRCFTWDHDNCVIQADGSFVHLSPIEGRIFELLLKYQGRTVTLVDLAEYALHMPSTDATAILRRLRPNVMRLRRKLAQQPHLTEVKIINARGQGYRLGWFAGSQNGEEE